MKVESLFDCTIAAGLLGLGLFIGACSGTDGNEAVEDESFDDKQVVTDYVDQAVVLTYTTLSERASALNSAVETFAEEPTDENLQAAQEAWVQARIPWERSESWLYGPVASNSYDPQLDSWPVDRNQLEQVIEENSPDAINREFVAGLSNTQKGFHTVEFLLFGDGGNRAPSDFEGSEKAESRLAYLTATTSELERIAGLLSDSWTDGVDGNTPYKEAMLNAGSSDSPYNSVQAAGQEIADGMAVILNEVQTGKLREPFETKDPQKVESQFSYNSRKDFRNNIRGVRHAYTSTSLTGSSGSNSLSAWVAQRDSELDSKTKTQIEESIAAIEAIPQPFRNAITNDVDGTGRDKIQTAMDKLKTLKQTVNNELKPMLK